MFGFSLTKLLVLAVIIGGVLFLFRLIGQKNAVQTTAKQDGKPETKAFDTEYDAKSDTFVVRNEKNQDK